MWLGRSEVESRGLHLRNGSTIRRDVLDVQNEETVNSFCDVFYLSVEACLREEYGE